MRRWVVLLAVVVAACGGGAEQVTTTEPSSTGPVGEPVTGPVRLTDRLVGQVVGLGEGRFAVVDGLSLHDGPARLTVRLVAADDGQRGIDGPDGVALVGVTTVAAGDELVVAGTTCPEVDRAVLDGGDFARWSEVCGPGGGGRVDVLSLTSGTWRPLLASSPGGDDYRVVGLEGDAVLVGVTDPGGSVPGHHMVPLDGAKPTDLGPPLALGEWVTAACPTDAGLAVAGLPADEDITEEPVPLERLGVTVTLVRDGTAEPVDLPPAATVARGLLLGDCLPDGGFVADPPAPEGQAMPVLRIAADGAAAWDEIALPAPSPDMPAAVTSGPGGLVVWTSTAARPDPQMGDIGFQGWLWHDGVWIEKLHHMGVDHPRDVVVSGTRIAVADWDGDGLVAFG